MGTQRTIINTKAVAEKIRLQYDDRSQINPTLRIRAADSIIIRNFRRIQRRDRVKLTTDASLLLTEYITSKDLGVDTLAWNVSSEVFDRNAYKKVEAAQVLIYTLTGPAYPSGSDFSTTLSNDDSFLFSIPAAGAVVAASIAAYTIDAKIVISSIDVFVLENVTNVTLNFVEPDQAALSFTNNGTENVLLANATSAIHVLNLAPYPGNPPATPISIVDSLVAANSATTSDILIAVPSIAAAGLGNYVLTVELSHATDPVLLMDSQVVEIA